MKAIADDEDLREVFTHILQQRTNMSLKDFERICLEMRPKSLTKHY